MNDTFFYTSSQSGSPGKALIIFTVNSGILYLICQEIQYPFGTYLGNMILLYTAKKQNGNNGKSLGISIFLRK